MSSRAPLDELELAGDKLELFELLLAEEGLDDAGGEALRRREDPSVRPLSPAQERLWFIDRLEPGSASYNMPLAVHLGGDLDLPAFQATLDEILRRHEALRSSFPEVDGGPGQEVAAPGPFPLPAVDLRVEGSDAAAGRIRSAFARRPFDLAAGPLVRGLLLRRTGHWELLLNLHHVVADGWSLGVLTREVAALYGAFRRGEPSPLPELPIQYADYAAWQRQTLAGERLEELLAPWHRRLTPLPPPLELPLDRPRPPVAELAGATRSLPLPATLGRELEELARSRGATLFMLLLAAFAALLERFTGGDDLAVGTPVANRERPEVEGLIGLFVNTLVLRCDLAGDPSFGELVDRVRAVALEAFDHQELPFERLVEALAPERHLGRNPLFEVMFTFQGSALREAGGRGPTPPGLELSARSLDPGVAKLDLSLTVVERPEGPVAVWEHATELFDATTVERLGRRFRGLLAEAVADPSRSLSQLGAPPAAERHQLLVEWQGGPATGAGAGAGHRTLDEPVAEQAGRTPDAVALVEVDVGGDRHLSYRALIAAARRLARELARRGVGPEATVALLLPRSARLVTAMLGVWQAGGVCLPLDPATPSRRLAFQLGDAGAELLLTPAEGPGEPARELVETGARVIHLGADGEPVPGTAAAAAEAPATESPDPKTAPEGLAYVIYTSGSTGAPKGVAVPHGAALRHLPATAAAYRLGRRDRVLLAAAPAFDVLFEQALTPLYAGATLVVREPGPWSAGGFLRTVAEQRLTVADLPPSFWLEVVREGEGRPAAESLRLIVLGGEALPAQGLAPFHRGGLGRARLVDVYGPTEATVTASFWPLPPGWIAGAGRVPIGRPLPERQAYVLDRRARPVPLGVPGELCLGGLLARGYLARPARTAASFIPHPWSGRAGGRLYRTGDRVRLLADGRLDFLGRLDDQVKLRGFRVELGEVEAALAGHPGVAEAAAAVAEGGAGGAGGRLLACVVPRQGEELEPGELRRFLGERLPAYMVPSLVAPVAALPRTAAGKVDRRQVAERVAQQAAAAGTRPGEGGAGRAAPLEEILAGIWSRVLGVESVGRDESFFELGGHSLLATRVISRVERTFGVELPVRALFESPSPAALAARIEELLRAAPGDGGAPPALPVAPPLVSLPREEGRLRAPVPLSFAQERLWFLNRLEPGSPAYNLPTALELTGEPAVRALALGLQAVVDRHEALRTTFAPGAEGPVQCVAPRLEVTLATADLSGLPAAAREEAARKLSRREAGRPFDLAAGPLLRATLLRLAPERHLLQLTLHHVITDGGSTSLLLGELAAAYRSLAAGREPALPELPVQYADFAVWQRRWLTGPVLEAQLAYWRRRLGSAPPPLELPIDRPRPPVQSFRGGQLSRAFTALPAPALEALARERAATPFMVALAACFALLGRLSGQDDLVVGTPVANRRRLEVEGLIGFFVNTLVLRADLAGEPAFGELVDQVRETALAAYAHQDLPFERLVEELAPRRDLARPPLFSILFLYQGEAEPALAGATPGGRGELTLPGLELRLRPVEGTSAKFDLTLGLGVEGETLAATAEYNADLFDPTTVARLLGAFERLLAGAVAAPERPLSELPLLSPAQRGQLLRELNDTGGAAAADGESLPALVAVQAGRTPERIALLWRDETWSYAGWLARCRGLARELAARGVEPEVRVAVGGRRRPALLGAVLAVLEAGGAYVPLDPAYPAERAAFMLADSGATVLLADGDLLPRWGSDFAGTALALEEAWEGAQAPRDRSASPAGSASPGNLSNLLYTSGSTGRPKGVAIEHRSAVALVAWARQVFAGGELAGVLAATSLCFDLSVFELFVPWSAGGTVILAGSVLELADLPQADRVRLVNTVPSAAAEVLRLGALPAAARVVNLAGEALPRELVTALHQRGVERVYNLYGPSEDTTYSTYALQRAEEAGTPPIGRPVAGTRAHVAGRWGELLPPGVPGELLLGGAGLARGYLGRPALTAERFLPDPWGQEPGGRLYRTGDRVRRRPDGELVYLGRLDHQVKLRGFRIELGEVEAALRSQPGVEEAVAGAVEAPGGDRRLVAWLILRAPSPGGGSAGRSGRGPRPESPTTLMAEPAAVGEQVELDALREALRRRLPEYMVPGSFVVLDAFPHTPSGKVDRRALAAAGAGLPGEARAGAYVAPRTPQEEILAGLVAEVLGRPGGTPVGVHDDFFALGGHSLLATRLVSRIGQVLGVELPLKKLFEAPTVAALAVALEERGERPAVEPIPRLARAGEEEELPLSHAQERLWFLESLDPGSAAYHLPAAVRLQGDLDAAALAWSFTQVVARHEVLRTRFPVREGRPVPRVDPPGPVALPWIDLQGLAPEDRAALTETLGRREALAPFDLAGRPPFRVRALRLEAEEHLLLVTFHHVAADGWSLGVLLEELGTLYGAAVGDRSTSLPELPIQYADYAAWQRAWLAGAEAARQLAYWHRRLAGAPAGLELPTDRPRPAFQTYRGGEVRRVLPPETAGRLGELGRREGATLFMTLLAAFGLLLGRLAGQQELVVGSPIAGRRRREVEGLIGIFLNTLALRLELAGDPPFRQLLARVREETLAAYDHQDVPFEKLLEELQPHRDLARTPLFQVFFNLLNLPARSRELPGLTLELAQVPELPSKFDLTLYAQEGEAGLHLELVYNAHLFDRARAEEMLGQLVGLLQQVVEEPEREVGALSLLTPEARRLLPDPRAELPRRWTEPVHQGVFRRAEGVPERVAVAAPGEAWSYAALAVASRWLAAELVAAGVERGQVVALLLPRSPALAAAVLGVLAAGAAFLILDPALPPARLAALLRRARPRAWLALAGASPPTGEPAAVLPELALPEITLEVELGAPGAGRTGAGSGPTGEPPPVEVGPGDLAYLAFTSGSTGEPKGILGAHGPLPHFLDWHAATFGLGEEERVSLLSGLGHDPLLRDLFTPLWLGAALVVPGAEELDRPGRLVTWMARVGVTVAHLTPAMGQLLAGDGPSDLAPDLPRVPSLSWLFFGGDVLTWRLVARLRDVAPRARVVSFYGTTETPQAMGWFPLPPGGDLGAGETAAGVAVPLGRGIDGVQLLVLGPGGALCGVGELGEIAVRTPYLALGYLGDDDATRERFLPNPATGRDDDRFYRTGDLGRYRPDATVAFAGRADDQVEIRGFRVEPAEVEAALESHPAVRESAVVPRTGAAGGTVLVAFAVLRRGAEAGPRELREHLRDRLPEAMVPAAVHLLPALPRTASGKLDRRALPAAEVAPRPASSAPPRDPTEELLAAIWARVLGLEAVGVHDDFFELGGHSLLAGRICARVAASFGVELPLRSLFEHPTVARLARAVEVERRRGLGGAAGPIPRARGPEREQLSFAQSRLWFLDRLDPGSPAYNLPGAVRITGVLQPAWLAASLAAVRARHRALRTTFPAVAGRPVARVSPAPAPELPAVDLSRLPVPRAREAARGLAVAEARRPFDLAAGPLMRAVLVRLAPGDHLLATTLHHIVADGWSMGVLVGEVARLYRALAAGEEPALPELPVQYADYAAWQRSWLAGQVLAGHLDFWRRRLGSDLPPLELPTDRPRPPVQTFRGTTLPVHLPEPLSAELTALARRREATPFMLLLAAFASLLGRLAGQEELAVGSPVANRGRVEIEGLIGFFVNTLVLPVELAGDPAFGQLLARVRETALAAYAHQELPFERLVEELAPQRDLARTPLFSVMLGLQSPAVEPLELPGLTFVPWEVDSGGAKFDLTVNLVQGPRGFAGTAEYNTDLFDRTTVTRWLGAFQHLLAGAVAAPQTRLSALPLLSPAQRGQLLWELNDTGGAAAAGGETLPALVAAQAGRTPERVALLWRDEAWSYAGWLERCRALARELAGRGVGPEVRVAVGGRRRPALLGAVLAVLEAGGAYVPLDPAYPAERVAFMLADSGATVLLAGGDLLPGWGAGFAGTKLALEEAWEGAQAPPRAPSSMADGGPGHRVGSGVPATGSQNLTSGNLSNLLYTSGSTGRPKGVAIEHRSAVALVAWARELFAGGELAGVLAATSLCFDLSVFELFVPWSAGGTVILADSVLELADLPQADRVRLVNTVPSAAAEVLRLGALPAAARVVNLAGEALPRELVSVLHQRGVERVYNLYGPSEDTTYSTYALQPRALQSAEEAGIPPIGRPVAGTRGHVAGPWGELLPPGVPGELLLGGAGLARGYLGRPALTAERFLPDPWGDQPGGRLYRTGDRVRRRPDGELVYLGRLDHQVKLRGFRIELGEVEAALRQQPGVEEAVAGVAEAPGGHRRLVAWLVLRQAPGEAPTSLRLPELGASGRPSPRRGALGRRRASPGEGTDGPAPAQRRGAPPRSKSEPRAPSPGGGAAGRVGREPRLATPTTLMAGREAAGGSAGSDALRQALRRHLPEYMVPGSFVVLDALPYTPSGKVDRRALAAAGAEPIGETRPGAALPPRNRLELELVRLFSEVLGTTEAVGVEADFFALGGHSLSAVRVVAEVEARLGRRLPVAALFQHPTPRSLAALLASDGPAAVPTLLVPVQPRGRRPALFCVHPAGGDALGFFPLARHLGSDQPLYAFQSVGLEAMSLEEEAEPLNEIGAMARRYLQELRAVQPRGPYRLAGWSLGGLVAYEMACLLAEAVERVELLALFDTGLPRQEDVDSQAREPEVPPWPEEGEEATATPPAADPAPWLAAMADYAGKLWGRELPLTREELQGLPPDQQQRRFLDALGQAGLLPPEAGGPWLRRLLRVFQANVWAAEAYRPRPYPGRLTLFRALQGRGEAEGGPAGGEPNVGGWADLAAQVEVIPVPGDHITLMAAPQVATLAAELRRLLAG